jgi:hypothetical protein
MLAVIILMAALVTAVIYPCFIVSSKCSRQEEKEEEFKGYLYCDDDCYMCGSLERCKKAVKKEG